MEDARNRYGLEPSDEVALLEAVVTGRKSIRAYTPKQVDLGLMRRILRLSSRAPSGGNMQPWKVHVLSGETLKRVTSRMLAEYERIDREPEAEIAYYPKQWREPYQARRREVGYALYAQLGIAKGDRAASRRLQGRNYEFFGAPVGLVLTIDRDLNEGSLMDVGMYLENVMLLAAAHGLATCTQVSVAFFHDILRAELGIPALEKVLCGVAVGYADDAAPENNFPTHREPDDAFMRFH